MIISIIGRSTPAKKDDAGQGTLYAAIDTAIRMGLFSLMASDDCSPKKVDELASRTGAEPALLSELPSTPNQRHLQVSGRHC